MPVLYFWMQNALDTHNSETPKDFEDIPENQEIFFLCGAITHLINVISNNPLDVQSINKLKLFLSLSTLPIHIIKDIFKLPLDMDILEGYISKHIPISHEEMGELTGYLGLLVGTICNIRRNTNIEWQDWGDPIMTESLLASDNESVEFDSNSIVARYNGKIFVRWVHPDSNTYWECNNISKLIYCALVILEELIHIAQIREEGKVKIFTLGFTFDTSKLIETSPSNRKENNKDAEFNRTVLELIARLQETDVTNFLVTAIPRIASENWQWFRDRNAVKPHEKHYPLRLQWNWSIGRLVAEFTGQLGEFHLETLRNLPDYLRFNFQNVIDFFSTYVVIGSIKQTYFRILFDDSYSLSKISPEQLSNYRKLELNRLGILDFFFQFCIYARNKYGASWIADSMDENPDIIKKILQSCLEFFRNNTDLLKCFLRKYKNADDSIKKNFLEKFKHRFSATKLAHLDTVDSLLDHLQQYIKVPADKEQ